MTTAAFPILLASFTVAGLLMFLIWAAWVLLNLWIWQKTKATGNMLMLVGAGILTLDSLLLWFNQSLGSYWITLIAFALLTVGFFLTVRVQVEAQLAAIRTKIHQATAGGKKDGGSNPPAAS